ncbi:MAG: chorismate synthase [Clostridia bacterium]|nr:chorismate synthase [Clostridia bacterium]
MAIFKGKTLTVEIYGESHQEKIGATVKGAPKYTFDQQKLLEFLDRRKAKSSVYSTSRKEDDLPVFTNVVNSTINGEFSVDIFNKNTKSGDYDNLYGKPRPSHADYTSYLKEGNLNYKGGGRFSGRLTAPLCAVGGIFKQYLEEKGIFIHAYVSKIGKIKGKSYLDGEIKREEILSITKFPALSNSEEMLEHIKEVKSNGDSVGGIIECIVYGMKTGVGDNLFEGLEGKISSLIYAVPAVKGVEFGSGFSLAEMLGSEANDPLAYKDEKVEILTNNAGGINGGISNGNPITLRVAVRPTPSIAKPQKTVDLVNKENVEIQIQGRHDACIVPRAVPCIESAVAIALVDELLGE